MLGADTDGNVQTINKGTTDNTTAINYFLETQELEFGNRAHAKEIHDEMVAFTHYGQDSQLQVSTDGTNFKTIPIKLGERVSIGEDINIEGNFFVFRWFGQSTQKAPVFEGLYLDNVEDKGTIIL